LIVLVRRGLIVGSFLDATRAARIAAGFPISVGKDIVFPKRKSFFEAIISPEDDNRVDLGGMVADAVLERIEEKQQLGLEIDKCFNIKYI
jgi:hypothetical protein